MLSNLSEAEQKNNQDIYLLNKQKINLIPKFPMINFFDLDPNTFKILNPYDLNEALNTINDMTNEKYKKNYFDDYYKKDFEFRGYEEDINFSIDNISFLTSTIVDNASSNESNLSKETSIDNFNYQFISLVNMVENKCILKQENKNLNIIGNINPENNKNINIISDNKDINNSIGDNKDINVNISINDNEDICDTGINFKLINKDEGKKEINIKCIVNPEILEKNIIENLIKKSPFPKAKLVYENIINYRKEFERCRIKSNGSISLYEFDIKIQTNSLNRIIYNKKGSYLLDLQHPPNYRTNFLIDPSNLSTKVKNNNFNLNNINNYTYYENIIFPFRNFEDEISNLKYRHFYILIEKKDKGHDKKKNSNGQNDNNEELSRILAGLFKNYNDENDETKFIYIENIPIYEEVEYKLERKYIKLNYELSDYFKYGTNFEIKKKLIELKFIKFSHNNKYEDDENDVNNIKLEIPEDEDAIKLYYQILALISEGILSYYNAIEFVENILFETKNYRQTIFKICNNEEYPILFNLSLEKLLDKYQNSLEEKTLSQLEEDLSFTFKSIYKQYLIRGTQDIINPTKNSFLMPVQRCTITPTYILFAPYALAQGNRILRDFISTPILSMLCSYKMDDYKEGRWNNQVLIEYIKYIMSIGFKIGEKKYRFFNFSQSQFRNKACWLLTEPEKILRRTGNYLKIKNVAKFGARVSQNLTTTIKTIEIPSKHIINIDDIKKDGIIILSNKKEKKIKYIFSDGVGKISYDLAEQITKKLKLKDGVPSCFQGRFLGCKGVWTTIFDDLNSNIYIRPSQNKFFVKPKRSENYFELCDYSRYIQAYLNRQIILLLNSLGVKNEVFIKKLERYEKNLQNEKFVLSLVHYSEWSTLFQSMYNFGINKNNDRLVKSLVESNMNILYNDIKNKARIYIEESAYVMGIMDEFNILEYGQAFLHIKRKNKDLILNQKCSIAKCPCLHPGDIRILDFKKYIPGDKNTEKYKIFEKYENVLIFPSKGIRPHPNECSGSDLDGDYYFVFYDKELIPKESNLIEPMNYIFDYKSLEKKTITINDIIDYFAEYINLNNLGIIGDAHLALADQDNMGAMGEIPRKLAELFSQAVDAPKTGLKIELTDDEQAQKYPHYMGKKKNKSYISNNILGIIYDNINESIALMANDKELTGIFYDEDLEIKGWRQFALLSLVFYRDYYKEMVNLLIKNEIKGESILLTGNNIDNEDSIFTKKKHNYDLREKITEDMRCLFDNYNFCFKNAISIFFSIKNKISPLLSELNKKTFFVNNLNLFASACYMICYNFLDGVLFKENSVEIYGKQFSDLIMDNLYKDDHTENIDEFIDYESENLGVYNYEIREDKTEKLYMQNEERILLAKDIIKKNVEDMKYFVEEIRQMKKIPKQANEENQYRILSFPWCISGNLLTVMKFLLQK